MASRALSHTANSLSPREQCGDNHHSGSANNKLDLLAEGDNKRGKSSTGSAASCGGTSLQAWNLLKSPWITAEYQLWTGFKSVMPGPRGGWGGVRADPMQACLSLLMIGLPHPKFSEFRPPIPTSVALQYEICALLSNTSHLLLIFHSYLGEMCGQKCTGSVQTKYASRVWTYFSCLWLEKH